MTDARYIISERKYSILSEVQEWPHSGKYEFLLQYPELEGYNRWKQTNFPLSEAYYQGKQEVEGYENVSITWTTRQWAGLQNSTGCSLLEGSISVTNWYYAIGTKKDCAGYGVNSMPGPKDPPVHFVYLWMRIPGISLNNLCTFAHRFSFHYSLLVIVSFFGT